MGRRRDGEAVESERGGAPQLVAVGRLHDDPRGRGRGHSEGEGDGRADEVFAPRHGHGDAAHLLHGEAHPNPPARFLVICDGLRHDEPVQVQQPREIVDGRGLRRRDKHGDGGDVP